jgi:hypothetical protein
MAIKKKFNVSGKLSGDIAFQTGQGQRRERDLRVAQDEAREVRRLRLAENARQEALELRKSETAQAREDRIAEAQAGREFTLERDVFARAGRVDDLEFSRESTTIAGRELAERQAREFALAAKHKQDGDERQYTVEQQRKKEAINSSRVKIDEGVANGTYTEFQAEQFHQELDKQELGLSKMWGPKQITPQDELRQRTFTADNGTLMYIDGTGKVQAYPGQLTPQEKLEAAEAKETQEYDWEVDRQKAEFEVQSKKADMIEKFMSGEFNEKSFDEVSAMVDKMFAAPAQTEQQQLDAIYEQGAKEGLSPEQIDAKLQAQSQPQQGKYGLRPDGTQKDVGFFGEIPLRDGVATEYSVQSDAVKVDGERIDFPTLVPTLTEKEVQQMVDILNQPSLLKKKIPEPIMQKAIKHAKKRLAEGKSVFYVSGEEDADKEKFLQGTRPPPSTPTGGVDEDFFDRGTKGALGGYRGGV